VKLGAQSGVNSSIKEENGVMIGTPVQDFHGWTKSYVLFRQFPKITNQIDELEKKIKELQKILNNNNSE
jgi:UDP-3-O-[3-hydroxymyristoyl] glucosamine N-acyltransferase